MDRALAHHLMSGKYCKNIAIIAKVNKGLVVKRYSLLFRNIERPT